MQRMLEKMANQLNAYDEASLMQLWQHYAQAVHNFEPSKRWEEAALCLCLVQAVHWKNQLFNHNLAASASPTGAGPVPLLPEGMFPKQETEQAPKAPQKAAVLRFPAKTDK